MESTSFAGSEVTGGQETVTLTEAQSAKKSWSIYSAGGNTATFRVHMLTNMSLSLPSTYPNGLQASSSVAYGLGSWSYGGDEAHDNLQPFITVYMWKRTA